MSGKQIDPGTETIRRMDRLLRKLGLGKGRLDLELSSTNYMLGDSVDGSVSYVLNKPEEGTELWVEVKATQNVTAPREVVRHYGAGGSRREVENQTSTFVLYEKRLQLDGHHLYDSGSHTFYIPLPSSISSPHPRLETPFDSWLYWGRPRGLVHYGHVKWHAKAKLVIPWSLGVSDSKKFYVVRRIDTDVKTPAPPSRPAGKNFCGGCGTRRSDGDGFCSHCGREFPPN